MRRRRICGLNHPLSLSTPSGMGTHKLISSTRVGPRIFGFAQTHTIPSPSGEGNVKDLGPMVRKGRRRLSTKIMHPGFVTGAAPGLRTRTYMGRVPHAPRNKLQPENRHL